jgi:peptide/nickel transport system ATP-binding protein
LLSIQNLTLRYAGKAVVQDVTLALHAGEVLGLIGESGSGKSLTAMAALGLLAGSPAMSGSIRFKGEELCGLNEAQWRGVRGRQIGMVFQDPMTSLNPLMTLGAQILETLPARHAENTRDRRDRAARLLAEVGLPDPQRQLDRYPFELSGGQQQRAMIAMVLAAEPVLLIADEPTTALDVTTQAQVLALLRAIQQRRGMALLFISHDLDAVLAMADRVAVMCRGQVVEQGVAHEVLERPVHAYTRALMAAHARRPAAAGRAVSVSAACDVRLDALCVDYGKRRVLHDVSLQLREGCTLGIAGESGSGKSTLARAVMGLVPPASGAVRVRGMDPGDRRQRTAFARMCQYVFQDTSGSLNPRRSILQALAEPLLALDPRASRKALAQRAELMLDEVGLDGALLARYPHQLSGGQRQRVVIARALAMQPRVLVCDEPVSALDATVRSQVLDLIVSLRDKRGLTLVFIGHDLAIMEALADEVLVMRQGRVVEYGQAAQVFGAPQAAYTRELLQAGRLARQAAAVPGPSFTPLAAGIEPAPRLAIA